MVKAVCRYLFSSSRRKGYKHWGLFKKTLILCSESVDMLIRLEVAAIRVARNHSKITSIVFLLYLYQFVSNPISLLCTTKVATELRIHNFTVFRTIIIFVNIFREHLVRDFQNAVKITQLVLVGMQFH